MKKSILASRDVRRGFIALLVLLSMLGISYVTVLSKSESGREGNSFELDGVYFLDTTSPFEDSTVKITPRSSDEIEYVIQTMSLGHVGNLKGVARKVSPTSLTYESTLVSEWDSETCLVTIVFGKVDELTYQTDGVGCSNFRGAHGAFFDDEPHRKNGIVQLPTISELGFTEADREKLGSLLPSPDLLGYAEDFIQNGARVEKLASPEFPRAVGYIIQTPNIYDGSSMCFDVGGGYCALVALMKDGEYYWILEGTNARDDFRYSTNHPEWMERMPEAFKFQLELVEVPVEDVRMPPY